MRAINIELLMGHSIGISNSYYRVTEDELLEDYLKAVPFLTIGEEKRLQLEMEELKERNQDENYSILGRLTEKDEQISQLHNTNLESKDAIGALADQVAFLMNEIREMKKRK